MDTLTKTTQSVAPKYPCDACGQPATRFRREHGQVICEPEEATAKLCEACFKIGSGMALAAFAAKLVGLW